MMRILPLAALTVIFAGCSTAASEAARREKMAELEASIKAREDLVERARIQTHADYIEENSNKRPKNIISSLRTWQLAVGMTEAEVRLIKRARTTRVNSISDPNGTLVVWSYQNSTQEPPYLQIFFQNGLVKYWQEIQ